MNITNTFSQASLTASSPAIAEELGIDAKARDSAAVALEESFKRATNRGDSDNRFQPTPSPSNGTTSAHFAESSKPPFYSPETAKGLAAAFSALERNRPPQVEEGQLCRSLKQFPNCSELYFLRAMIRQDAGDDLRSVDDYQQVLRIEPDNLIAKLARLSCLARTFGSLRKSDVAEITRARRELLTEPEHRFAVVVKSGLGGPGAPKATFDQEFLAIQKAAYREGKDRCVSALMTVMLFEQWFWRSDHDCLFRAKDSARQMLDLWPRDRLAVSVLYWLGEGNKYGNIPDLEFRRNGENLYHKSHLGRRIIFDYPILIQLPEIRTALRDISAPS